MHLQNLCYGREPEELRSLRVWVWRLTAELFASSSMPTQKFACHAELQILKKNLILTKNYEQILEHKIN